MNGVIYQDICTLCSIMIQYIHCLAVLLTLDYIVYILGLYCLHCRLYCIHCSAVLLTLDYIVEVFTLLAEVRSELQ